MGLGNKKERKFSSPFLNCLIVKQLSSNGEVSLNMKYKLNFEEFRVFYNVSKDVFYSWFFLPITSVVQLFKICLYYKYSSTRDSKMEGNVV